MTSKPLDDTASDGSERSRTEDEPPDAGSGGDVPDAEVADDGSVPAKQIHRWKGEGGSLHPDD